MAGAHWDGADTRPLDDREPRPGLGLAGLGAGTSGHGAHRGARRREAPQRRAPWWGTRPGRAGVLTVFVFAAAGAVVAVATRRDPGPVVGAFVFAGTVAAALIVRPYSVHAIIPVPALAYLVTALVAGLIRDPSAGASRTAFLTGGAQWLAGGFLAMVLATAVAIAITVARRTWADRGPRHHST